MRQKEKKNVKRGRFLGLYSVPLPDALAHRQGSKVLTGVPTEIGI
jgi:hypothetical protein